MKHEYEQSSEIIEMWYHTYSDDIYRYILMLTGDHELAKDLMHDTFLKAFKSVDTFQGRSSDKNWLYQIARNVTIDYKRKKSLFNMQLKLFSPWHQTLGVLIKSQR
ncbi:RNA polymerase sigma factor [Alkalihalobacterium chitinilyticum]|uniref:Sigma-70 family RNA polymerase sigma factor n=1 Tax=Alkalihalobacterium chitinilyticum TaxID=2980103 RepID=A0ABT5VMD1_9BACI|nr:sigma-70 family RNA polymerase sigma factor [Alkalihalobacterium chitinilyticum]MDE5415648.1 sigma-70 family RNA polymerase sigma factor [Alkalihalobacterium chitinilyticum]